MTMLLPQPSPHSKGIVLLSTIALIMLLSLVVLKSSTITEKYFRNMNQTLFFAQKNRLFMDVVTLLKTNTAEINSPEAFSKIVGLPLLLHDAASDLEGSIYLASGANVLNIHNLLDKKGEINTVFYDFLERVLLEHNVRDMHFFLAVLLDALDANDTPRVFASEIAKESLRFSDGHIFNHAAFVAILDYYAKLRNDRAIYTVPWEEIIGFTTTQTDINHITPRLREYFKTFYGVDAQGAHPNIIATQASLDAIALDSTLFEALAIDFYVPLLACAMRFSIMGQTLAIHFNYNLTTKEVGSIETIF